MSILDISKALMCDFPLQLHDSEIRRELSTSDDGYRFTQYEVKTEDFFEARVTISDEAQFLTDLCATKTLLL